MHVFGDIRAAGYGGLGHERYLRRAVRLFEHLSGGPAARRKPYRHEAHSARARHFQVGMVAEERNFNANRAARLQDALPRLDEVVRAVDVNFYLLRFHAK